METVATRRVATRRLPYLRRVLGALDEHLPAIDRVLQDALENWNLNRLSSIDRGILRLAAAEMLHLDDIPPKVSIQEGIRLAEIYGGQDSPRFVNGVLDALYKTRAGRRG
jgi:transcription antitermination protein NusB